MRNSAVLAFFVILALAAWAGLLLFMNRNTPDSANQIMFLLIVGGAVWCTAVPIAYGLGARLAASLGRVGDLNRAVRRGLFAGVLASALLALRFLRLLTVLSGASLVLIVVLLEVLFSIRRR